MFLSQIIDKKKFEKIDSEIIKKNLNTIMQLYAPKSISELKARNF